MDRPRTFLPALCAALSFVQLLAACSFSRSDGAIGFETTLIFCDIEADRRCASNDEIMSGIDVAKPFESGFWLGKSSPLGLDYSPAALAACGGGPQAVQFRDAFPTGTPACVTPSGIGPSPAAFRTVADACHSWCSQQGFVDPDGSPYNCNQIAWPSNGVPQGTPPGFVSGCTNSGTLLPDFADPRKLRPSTPIAWTAAVGVTVNGSDLTKTASQGWGSADPAFAAGAVSTQQLATGNGAATLVAAEANRLRMFGLGNGATSTTFEDVEFGLLLTQAGTLQIFESGTFRGIFGTYATGDRFEVAVEEGFVLYKQNEVVLYTSTVFPTYPLRANAALHFTGATITGARITF